VRRLSDKDVVDVIKLDFLMRDPQARLFGTRKFVKTHVDITDGFAIWRSDPSFVVQRLCLVEARKQQEDGEEVTTFWQPDSRMGVTRYPGKSKDEIKDLTINNLKRLGVSVK